MERETARKRISVKDLAEILKEEHPSVKVTSRKKEELFCRLRQMFNSIYEQEETKNKGSF